MRRNSSIAWLAPAIGFLVFAWVLFILLFDIGEVDDSDLALPVRVVDPSRNPFPEIRDHELGEEELAEFRRVKAMQLGSEEMDSTFLLEMLARHRPLLERFHRYAAMEDWERDHSEGFRSSPIYALHWADTVPLALADSARLAAESKVSEAIDINLSVLRFASRLQSSGVNKIEWAAAGNIRIAAYRGLANLIARVPLERTELVRIAETMDDPFLSSTHFDLMIRVEFPQTKAIVKIDAVAASGTGKRWIPHRAIYKENRTMHALAESHRHALRLAETTLIETRNYSDANAYRSPFFEWIAILGGNREGRDLVHFTDASLSDLAQFSFVARAFHQVLRTRVAMERYRLDHGAWPAHLTAMVPAYLNAVPIDSIDGKPLRYDRNRKVIYSIGSNLIDENGIAPDRKGALRDHNELVIELEPAEAL